jgi:hypothetical protein
MIWPSGDSAKLRAAAAAWITAGTQFALGEILGTGAPMGAIRAQQIPEGAVIDRAFTDAYSSTTSLVQQCQQIAAQLTSYAAKVDKVHAAILDLLARICDPLTGIKGVWDILTDEDEDEIKQIADDIRTVVDNFKAEVQALEAQIASTLAEATTIVTTMADYAARQWDQFLHSTGVGHAIDLAGHYAKNMWGEAGEAVEGLWNISSFRMLIDPIGYGKGIAGMTLGAAPLVGLGPDGAPSVWDSPGRLRHLSRPLHPNRHRAASRRNQGVLHHPSRARPRPARRRRTAQPSPSRQSRRRVARASHPNCPIRNRMNPSPPECRPHPAEIRANRFPPPQPQRRPRPRLLCPRLLRRQRRIPHRRRLYPWAAAPPPRRHSPTAGHPTLANRARMNPTDPMTGLLVPPAMAIGRHISQPTATDTHRQTARLTNLTAGRHISLATANRRPTIPRTGIHTRRRRI